MPAPLVYLTFPGNAREALGFYAEIFGGTLTLHTLAEFGRTDGDPDAIAHGTLDGLVALAGSDATGDEEPVALRGVRLSLLGTAAPAILHEWFDALADGASSVDPLQPRPWGATDGQVVDRYGLRWLIGYEPES